MFPPQKNIILGELNEGDYLDKCNSLKKQYNNIKFASM